LSKAITPQGGETVGEVADELDGVAFLMRIAGASVRNAEIEECCEQVRDGDNTECCFGGGIYAKVNDGEVEGE